MEKEATVILPYITMVKISLKTPRARIISLDDIVCMLCFSLSLECARENASMTQS